MQDVLLKLIFQNIFWPNVYDSCHDVLQKVQVSLNKILSVKRLLGEGWGEMANFVKLCGGFGELSLVYLFSCGFDAGYDEKFDLFVNLLILLFIPI